MFVHICLHLDDVVIPGSRTFHPILWIKIFLDSRLQYESLDCLMDFQAFLVQK